MERLEALADRKSMDCVKQDRRDGPTYSHVVRDMLRWSNTDGVSLTVRCPVADKP